LAAADAVWAGGYSAIAALNATKDAAWLAGKSLLARLAAAGGTTAAPVPA
jgi:hypothetical protein